MNFDKAIAAVNAIKNINPGSGCVISSISIIEKLVRVGFHKKETEEKVEVNKVFYRCYWITGDVVSRYRQSFLLDDEGKLNQAGKEQIKAMQTTGIKNIEISRALGIHEKQFS